MALLASKSTLSRKSASSSSSLAMHHSARRSSAAIPPRPARIHFQPDHRTPSQTAPPLPSPRKNLKGPCIITLQGYKNATTSMGQPQQASVRSFMSDASSWLSDISLPMGGKLTMLDETRMQMDVPKIEIFDLYLQVIR